MSIPVAFKATHDMIIHHLDNIITTPAVKGLYRLLCTHTVSSSGDSPGITWLELYMLCLAFTPDHIALTHGQAAKSARTIAQQLSAFIASSKQFLHFAVATHFQ
eukprot:7805877-Karenia_brevis.AAC.1